MTALFGQKWTSAYGLADHNGEWQRTLDGLVEEKWHFHDLKAKGVSDHEGLVSGRKTLEAKKIYIRKTQEVQGTR